MINIENSIPNQDYINKFKGVKFLKIETCMRKLQALWILCHDNTNHLNVLKN